MFSVIFGIALAMVPEPRRRPVLGFAESLAETMFKFTNIVMHYAPFGVGAAIAYTVGHGGLGVLYNLAWLVITLYLALAAFILLGVVAFGVTVPSSPGYFGVIQLCFLVVLKLFVDDHERVFAASIYYHMVQWVPVTLLGLWYFNRSGLKVAEVEEEAEQGVRIPLGRGFAGTVAVSGKAVSVYDVDHSMVLNPILRQKGVRSLLGVPLVVQGDTIGVLHVGTLTHRHFTPDDEALLQLAEGESFWASAPKMSASCRQTRGKVFQVRFMLSNQWAAMTWWRSALASKKFMSWPIEKRITTSAIRSG